MRQSSGAEAKKLHYGKCSPEHACAEMQPLILHGYENVDTEFGNITRERCSPHTAGKHHRK